MTPARAPFRILVLVAALWGTAGCSAAADKAARAELDPDAVQLVAADAERLLQEVSRPGAEAVLLNVWATWCGPCREEFPDLVRLEREYADQGLRLVLVSGDFEDQEAEVRGFLAEHGVDFPSYLKTGKDQEFIDTLSPEWSGALPATFVYDGRGRLVDFWEGKASYATLRGKVEAALAAGATADAKEENTR